MLPKSNSIDYIVISCPRSYESTKFVTLKSNMLSALSTDTIWRHIRDSAIKKNVCAWPRTQSDDVFATTWSKWMTLLRTAIKCVKIDVDFYQNRCRYSSRAMFGNIFLSGFVRFVMAVDEEDNVFDSTGRQKQRIWWPRTSEDNVFESLCSPWSTRTRFLNLSSLRGRRGLRWQWVWFSPRHNFDTMWPCREMSMNLIQSSSLFW